MKVFNYIMDHMKVFNYNMDYMKVFNYIMDQMKVFNYIMDHMKVFMPNPGDLKVSLNGWMKSRFIRLLLAISENNSFFDFYF